MPELAYLNGKIMPISDAAVPIEDRGYQFGDAVYEYIVSYNGRLFALDAHLERLQRSMRELLFPQVASAEIKRSVIRLFEKAEIPRAGIYIQISRGVGPRGHAFLETPKLQKVMTIRAVPISNRFAEKGARMLTVKDFRWGRCDIKTVQLLPNVLAKQRALDAGMYDAIFIAKDETVREATSSNVFLSKDGKIFTHPLTQRILPGITRRIILDICRQKGISCEQCYFKRDEMMRADEVFLTGTLTEVLPVIAIDGQPIGNGKVGSIAKLLYRELRRRGDPDFKGEIRGA